MTTPTTKEERRAENERRLNLYNKIVTEANLAKLILTKVDYQVNHSVMASDKEPSLKYHGSLVEFDHDKDAGAIIAGIKWTADIRCGRKKALHFVANYVVIYDGFSTDDAGILERFADNVARPASYSYFRSLFATLDWASDLRTKPLPVVKFFPRI